MSGKKLLSAASCREVFHDPDKEKLK